MYTDIVVVDRWVDYSISQGITTTVSNSLYIICCHQR